MARRPSRKPDDLSYTGGLNRHKGWQRALWRKTLGALLIAGIAWVLSAQYGLFKEFASKAGASRQAVSSLSSDAPSMARMIERLESGEVTEADVQETERLMAKIQGGQAVDSGQRQALDQLAKRSAQPPRTSDDPQARKLWALLSDWSNEAAETETPEPAAPIPSAKRVAVQQVAAKSPAWKVELLVPSASSPLRGLVTVRARVTGPRPPERVEFRVNGEWVGLSDRAPYDFAWDTAAEANGAKTLSIVAIDAMGVPHTSRPRRVTVAN